MIDLKKRRHLLNLKLEEFGISDISDLKKRSDDVLLFLEDFKSSSDKIGFSTRKLLIVVKLIVYLDLDIEGYDFMLINQSPISLDREYLTSLVNSKFFNNLKLDTKIKFMSDYKHILYSYIFRKEEDVLLYKDIRDIVRSNLSKSEDPRSILGSLLLD